MLMRGAPRIVGGIDVPTPRNTIRNVRGEGAIPGIIGEGGALPTLWSHWIDCGLTLSVIGGGIEDGIPYAEVRISGTVSEGFGANLYGNDDLPVSTGDWATVSAYLRITASARPSNLYVGGSVYDGSRNWIDGATGWPDGDLTGRLIEQRAAGSVQITNPAAAAVRWGVTFSGSVGETVDVTIRIGAPQMTPTASVIAPQIPAAGSAE